jgi:hypothetical protein
VFSTVFALIADGAIDTASMTHRERVLCGLIAPFVETIEATTPESSKCVFKCWTRQNPQRSVYPCLLMFRGQIRRSIKWDLARSGREPVSAGVGRSNADKTNRRSSLIRNGVPKMRLTRTIAISPGETEEEHPKENERRIPGSL